MLSARTRIISSLLWILFCILNTPKAHAYAVLAHEAIIDASWANQIKPLLLKRYPGTTDSAMKVAHSYAYGGCMMADMGYMPMGSEDFSDMMHYVRSGEMIRTLISEAQNVNEFAFALGALSHYLADEYGHSKATNLVVPMLYKKLQKKYGNFVTYGDDNVSHSRTEFSFDVLQVARGNYNPQAYHDFIGFNISRPVLERAFLKTYGIKLEDIFGDFDKSVGTMRWGVNKLFPDLIKHTWKADSDTIMARQPGATARQFHYKMSRKQYYKEFGRQRVKEGFWASFLTIVIRTMPKIGPFKTLKYVDPGQKGEKLFVKSFDTILVCYNQKLHEVGSSAITLTNIDFDTGRSTQIGEYALADQTYARLVERLADHKFENLTPQLKAHLLAYYNNVQDIPDSKKYHFDMKKLQQSLQDLKQAPVVNEERLTATK